jgi:LPXTG-site transpeptidase (sortase) family protein
VGATQFDPTDESGPGKVVVYRRVGGLWSQEAYLEAEDGRTADAFGNSVSIYGSTVVVGASHADPKLGVGRVTSAGAAYVFTDNGDKWGEVATLTAPNGLPFEQFGQSVDIYADTVVVGADGATQMGNSAAGAVYVFKKANGEWSLQTRAVTDPAQENDLFGRSVGVYGNWFVVGASGRDPDSKTRAGEAFLNLLGAVQLPATGFAPGVLTRLPAQPASLAYQDEGGMALEIPALGVQMTIAGVLKSGNGWDVRWLGDQAGYLEGTAFPTWQGNTGLAGHTVLPDGEPGPFARLHTLSWGDQVIIHAWGQRYIYEVRENTLVKPEQLAVLKHEDLAWVTLITCQDYDSASGAYRWRRVVRAVLVSVQE